MSLSFVTGLPIITLKLTMCRLCLETQRPSTSSSTSRSISGSTALITCRTVMAGKSDSVPVRPIVRRRHETGLCPFARTCAKVYVYCNHHTAECGTSTVCKWCMDTQLFLLCVLPLQHLRSKRTYSQARRRNVRGDQSQIRN